jgi:hypothetical protein
MDHQATDMSRLAGELLLHREFAAAGMRVDAAPVHGARGRRSSGRRRGAAHSPRRTPAG